MKQINMLESPVRQVFFSYLVPSISATLVTSIYILADTMMIGRGVGGSGIAAMNILLPLYNTYFGIGMMCGVGGSVLFGFSRGRGDEKRARSYFTAALCVVLALSAVFLILGRIFFNPLITFMGNTPLLNEYTVPYGTVLTTAAPMFALSSFLQAFVRNDGAPKLAMAGVISAIFSAGQRPSTRFWRKTTSIRSRRHTILSGRACTWRAGDSSPIIAPPLS